MIAIRYQMSNFDHSIDSGMEDFLKSNPNTHYGFHSALNFNGKVYFDGNKFVEKVFVHHQLSGVVKADSLKELMLEVNFIYGGE